MFTFGTRLNWTIFGHVVVINKISLLNSGFGCFIVWHFLGCFVYAGDIILLSPLACKLWCMLGKCTQYGVEHNILFNSKKSLCAIAGRNLIMLIYCVCTSHLYPNESIFLGT